MNVFIPFADTFKTAKVLDKQRLQKQIIECDTMINAITDNRKAWRRHPCTLMYLNHIEWMQWYRGVLSDYKNGLTTDQPEPTRPSFIGDEELHKAHRARLYQKNPIHYKEFELEGTFTELNWYIVDGFLLKYKNGKLVEKTIYKK